MKLWWKRRLNLVSPKLSGTNLVKASTLPATTRGHQELAVSDFCVHV